MIGKNPPAPRSTGSESVSKSIVKLDEEDELEELEELDDDLDDGDGLVFRF